jgi:nitrogen fixation protein FixH
MRAHASKPQRVKADGLRGVHVFWIIAGFFAVTFAVNALFISRAVGTFPGEDVRNSYVQGNDYNATLMRRAEQTQLGWTAEAGLESAAARVFVFRLKDANGRPLSGLEAELHWRWIGRDADDADLSLHERAPGEYIGALPSVGPGRMSTRVDVRRPEASDIAFAASKTLVVE